MRESNLDLEAASMELARRIARKVFAGDADAETKVADAVSVAWEFSHTTAETATPKTVAYFAVKRVKTNSQFGRSVRSIDARCTRAGKRVRSQEAAGFHLEDFAGKQATPDEIVTCKLDAEVWWMGLDSQRRNIAEHLAMGYTTTQTANRFGLSAARISQIRKELRIKWEAFQG